MPPKSYCHHVNKQASRRRSERRDGTRLRLWPIGWVLTASFAAVMIGLAGLWWIALVLLNYPKLQHSKTISVHDAVGVAQLVFASVAGAGALVALVMAYRRQRVNEISTAHDQARVRNERFTAIATQLGDHSAAVRLAGIHALAGLADDWPDNRQTCIDVLCAYLRMPFMPKPSDDADPNEKLAFRGHRESKLAVIRVYRRPSPEGCSNVLARARLRFLWRDLRWWRFQWSSIFWRHG